MGAEAVRVTHPNRDKPASKATKAGCVLLLVVSAVLVAVITAGGWEKLQGGQGVAIFYALVTLVMAYFVLRWNRGVLTLAAGLAVLFSVMFAVAVPAWFARDKEGFAEPLLPPEMLGLLTIVLIGVQILLIIFAIRGFTQAWNVEVEVPSGHPDPGYNDRAFHTGAYEDSDYDAGYDEAGGYDPAGHEEAGYEEAGYEEAGYEEAGYEEERFDYEDQAAEGRTDPGAQPGVDTDPQADRGPHDPEQESGADLGPQDPEGGSTPRPQ